MRLRLQFFTALLSLVVSASAFSQNAGYDIKFRIRGLKDTVALIANYYGNGTYVKDTVKVDAAGKAEFKAPDTLPRGVYIFVINDKKYFEFIVNNDKKFTLETDKAAPQDKVIVEGSPENKLFYDYLDYNRKKYAEIQDLQARYDKLKDNPDSSEYIKKEVTRINNEIIKFKLDIVKNNPGSFMAFMINAMKEPEIPEIPTLPGGKKDSTYAYRYFKGHFWDDTDFTDDRLLRTPVFHNKLKRYFDQVVVQQPDSIIIEIDRMAAEARPNKEMYKYIIWFSTWHYENSDIMGFDKVFVHVVDTYYKTGQAYWVTPAVLDGIIKKSDKIKPLLLGSVAPNMVMVDTSNQLVSMHTINANILIILFWDPDCGHCVAEIPKLKEFYDEYKDKYGMQVFAVCSDSSLVKWKTEIRKRNMDFINVDGPRTLTGDYHTQYDIVTTPVIYILNRKKEIIAKNIKTEQVSTFVRNYLKSAGHP
jgi:thiol-disulfide isomerase/thioredoxin